MNRTSSPPAWVEITVIKALWAYIPLILLLATFIGNTCTVVVLLRKNVRKRRGTVYLLCLVVVDFVAICTGSLLSKWVEFGLGKINRLSPRCNIVQDYINRVARTVATFLLVSMTLERVVSVWLPFIASKRCKQRVAYIDLVVIFLFTSTFYSHVLFGPWLLCPGLEVTQCPADWPSNHPALSPPVANTNCSYFRFTVDMFPLLDAAVNSYLPLVVVVVGDVAVAYRVLVKTKWVFFTTAEDGGVNTITGVGRRKASRMTQLTTLLNAVYFMAALPLAIQLTIQKTAERNFYESRGDAQMALSWTVTVLVMYTRAALDFPILLAFCPLFRAECRLLVTLIHLHVCTLCHPTVLHKVLPRSVTPDIDPKVRACLSVINEGTAEYSFPAGTNRGTTESSLPAATMHSSSSSSFSSSSSSSSFLGNVYKPPPLEPVEEGVEDATLTRDRSLLTHEELPSSGSSKKGALSASTRKKKQSVMSTINATLTRDRSLLTHEELPSSGSSKKGALSALTRKKKQSVMSTIKVLNRFVWDEPINVRSATSSPMTAMMIAESLDSARSMRPGFLFTISHGITPALKSMRKRKVTPTPFISLQTSSPHSSSLEDAPPRKTVCIEGVAGTSTQTDVLIMHEVAKRSSPSLLQRAPNPSASLLHTGSGPAAFPSVSSPTSSSRGVGPCIAEEETPRGDVSDKSSIRSQGGREKTGED